MRMTVQQLIDELKTCKPEAAVEFNVGTKDVEPLFKNHVQRVDNFGHAVIVVVEKGV